MGEGGEEEKENLLAHGLRHRQVIPDSVKKDFMNCWPAPSP
jgi:hypothetical protein